jgi:hypothetical protein
MKTDTSPGPVERLVGWQPSSNPPYNPGDILITNGVSIIIGRYIGKAGFRYVTRVSVSKSKVTLVACDDITHWMPLPDMPSNAKDQWPGQAPGHATTIDTRSTASPLLGKD